MPLNLPLVIQLQTHPLPQILSSPHCRHLSFDQIHLNECFLQWQSSHDLQCNLCGSKLILQSTQSHKSTHQPWVWTRLRFFMHLLRQIIEKWWMCVGTCLAIACYSYDCLTVTLCCSPLQSLHNVESLFEHPFPTSYSNYDPSKPHANLLWQQPKQLSLACVPTRQMEGQWNQLR